LTRRANPRRGERAERPAELIETSIESLAAGGDGVGRLPDGRALFVPLTAPGDVVRVQVVLSKKRFARGTVVDVLEPSPDRVEPRCAVFGECGGCAWQHIAYSTQLRAKARILREALVRIGRFDLPDDLPLTASPQAYGYRNRARLLQADVAVGYRMRRSHRVCGIDRCPVLQPALERALAKLAVDAARSKRAGSDALEWELLAGDDGTSRTFREGDSSGGAVTMRAAEDRLRISAGVFAQGNALLLDALVRAVANAAGRGASLVELFAGAGLLTLELSRRFDCVWALESGHRAVADLRFNLDAAGRSNVEVCPGRVEQTLGSLAVARPDAVVLDPPRTGVPPAALDQLARLRPKRIVYLSCDPATLARDLARLRTEGYRLEHVEAFDLFPQTPHVEALTTLSLDPTRRDPLQGG
jgi:23S rRNA (uracil1939-C5)-methyltransferase